MYCLYLTAQFFLEVVRFLGHGAPALLSCLWLENSLSTYYPQYTRDKDGLHKLISRFSVPGGFPRCVATSTPPSLSSLTVHTAM